MYLPVFSLRLPVASILIWSVLWQMIWWATPAQSQGFFQQLFGISSAPQVRTAPVGAMPRMPVAGAPIRLDRLPPPPRYSAGQRVAPEGTGSFTTVCVRMCDGFHFPVSQRVPRNRFYHDAEACRSRCGESESRLFYHSFGADMKSAVDLTGRAYKALPIAFLHRKRLVAGCTCKPAPWSEAALIRHEGYAIAEGRSVPGSAGGMGGLSVVAGNYSTSAPLIEPPSTRDPAPEDTNTASADNAATQPEPAEAQTEERAGARTVAAAPRAERPRRTQAAAASGMQRPAQARAAARPAPPRKSPVVMASAQSAPKLVWPGDAPTRTR